MLDGFAGPNLAHGGDIIIKPRAAFFPGRAHGAELFFEPTNAGAQHETAIGDKVEACNQFCQTTILDWSKLEMPTSLSRTKTVLDERI